MYETESPGVIKLFGEHAVVYGKLSLAAAISLYAYSSIEENPDLKGKIKINLIDFKDSITLNETSLKAIYQKYTSTDSINEFVESSNYDRSFLPFIVITSRIMSITGKPLSNLEISLHSDIPTGKGCASSAACSTAFTVSLLRYMGKHLDDKTVIDIARDGERVVHLNKNAGSIDVTTSFYGGYATFSSKDGPKPVKSIPKIRLILIDTGPKKSTAETVGTVKHFYDTDKAGAIDLLNEIDECSNEGLNLIKKSDMNKDDLQNLGKLMHRNQDLLREFGVSSESLDEAISEAERSGVYGAKLSGGGGGGIAIGLIDKDFDISRLSKLNVTNVEVSSKGSKQAYNSIKSKSST